MKVVYSERWERCGNPVEFWMVRREYRVRMQKPEFSANEIYLQAGRLLFEWRKSSGRLRRGNELGIR